MNENEKMIEPEINPYDRLIEQENEPVKSPVILGNAGRQEKPLTVEKSIEIIPLASEASYNKIPVRECRTVEVIFTEAEEDMLIPDTFPDAAALLNIDAAVDSVEICSENGSTEVKGKISLEIMYRSDESYGNNICVLPAELKFGKKINAEGTLRCNTQIKKVEYRLMNERKYKVKVFISIDVNCESESEYLLFEGIEGEIIYIHKEPVNFMDMISRKTSEIDISEELFLNDDKIRPVKILKSKVTVAENHRQMTKEKLILNQTLWVRIMYLAEIASKGNLSNQVMFFQGKIDHTQFISLDKSEGEIAYCTATSDTADINVEINHENSGFNLSGTVVTEMVCYGIIEKDIVTDFYHDKEEMTCDYRTEKVYSNINCITAEQTVRESIGLQQESGADLRIIYMDAQPVDMTADTENDAVTIRGKLHIEAVIMNEGDYTVLAKKICDFSCVKELPQGISGTVEISRIFVREMSGNISGSEVNITAHVQADLNMYNEAELIHINNPCIVRSGEPARQYPITIHTVIDGESVWDIGKKYKVSEECIIAYNKPENICPGNKIIVVK